MKAVMSDKLRSILRDPQGRRDLQKAMSQSDSNKSMDVTVRGKHYKIEFITEAFKAK